MALLSDREIQEQLAGLQGWIREGDAITKRYELAGFPVLTLSTDSEGGITQKDFAAARSFETAL